MKTRSGSHRTWARRALSLLLAAVMVLGFLPDFPGAENSEAEAQWAEPYLNQLVEWGFIRADQANNPNLALTRADFMAIVNRAYGYSTPGETPFEDVEENKWYYDDVGIAYNARYIVGTSPTTASPNDPLTRETATTILGRNMMLQESPGEVLDFTDARQISNWAMGTVKSSLEHYLINGYDDGTLRPKRNVSWGEMAAMITKLIGTPLQESGDYALGGVFGNVTITSSNVTLRDTMTGGDVYVTGGVGLGNVKMENVNVLGRIIASGTGRSEGGEASILLRNVTADELLIDNLQNDYVSVQVDGITDIARTTVRTSAYIEDNTPDGMGLQYISIEGETYPEGEEPEGWEPIQVDLAGRIGEVVNLTPKSQVRVAKGTVEKLTVDEAAVDSTVIIDRGAVVKELNLDTASTVTGEGDIGHLVVNAPGCVIDIMPDQITIRPGITAIICGVEMDSMAAEEFSMEPLILAGYPEARDITPTGLQGVFMTNKAGTIYYAVSAITDGSVGEDDLIKPPSYGSIAVASGSVRVEKGNEEVTASIGGLTPGGSYYLSAVLVDAKGNRSPVKVIAFTTPDNTIPAFCAGYPYMSSISPKDSVVVTMTTKDCKLYYALLPEGAVAPTENEMRANAVAGALGFGVRDAYKNIEDVFRVNDQLLAEQTTYVLYFFLMDADGVNKSGITSITFTTADETPPYFVVDPTVTTVQATSVGLTFQLNENGTVYWVAIPANTINYPKPEPGTDFEYAPQTSDYGKLQIENGMNIGTEGKSGRVTCQAFKDGTITVSGLKPETAYDFYYVAKDTAGNYTVIWDKITIYTLDTTGPKFSQSFSNTASSDDRSNPYADTAIYLDVSEDVRYTGTGGTSFLQLYQAVKNATSATEKNAAINKLAASLYGAIKLYKYDSLGSSKTSQVPSKWQTGDTINWTIDYTQATVEAHEGGIRITFPKSALHLENGGAYYFTISDVTDVSNNQNPLVPAIVDFHDPDKRNASLAGGHDVPVFYVEFARVNLYSTSINEGPLDKDKNEITADLKFEMEPESTGTVSNDIRYDVLLWTSENVAYELYYRVLTKNGERLDEDGEYQETYTYTDPSTRETTALTKSDYLLAHLNPASKADTADENGWIYLGVTQNAITTQPGGRSVNGGSDFNGFSDNRFPQLNKLNSNLHYQFVIHLTKKDGVSETDLNGKGREQWAGSVTFNINVAAGPSGNLYNLAPIGTGGIPLKSLWDTARAKGLYTEGGVASIGYCESNTENPDTLEWSCQFSNSYLPNFATGLPTFKDSETIPGAVDVTISLNGDATLYYLADKATSEAGHPVITTTRTTGDSSWEASIDQADVDVGGLLKDTTTPAAEYWVRMSDVSKNDPDHSLAPYEDGRNMPEWMIGGIKEANGVATGLTDDPAKDNLLVNPTRENVRFPKSSASTSTAINGSKEFYKNIQDTLTIEGLEYETDYFFYFVIQNEIGALSHVYVYHFKTKEADKPKIDADADTEGAVITVEAKSDTRVRYYVFSLADVEALGDECWLNNYIYVSEAYYNWTGSKDRIEIEDDVGEDGETIHRYKMTIMQAIATTYYNEDPAFQGLDGYSVFDVYADTTLKGQVGGYLMNGSNMNQLTKKADGAELLNLSPEVQEGEIPVHPGTLESGTEYVLIAVAWDANAGSKNDFSHMSFGGEIPIPAAEAGAPRARKLTGELYGSIKEADADKGYEGMIEIRFNKRVFCSKNTSYEGKALDELTQEQFFEVVVVSADLRSRIESGAVQLSITPETRITLTGKLKDGDTLNIYGYRIQSANKEINEDSDLKVRVEQTKRDGADGMRIYMKWEDAKNPSNDLEEDVFYPFSEAKEITVSLTPTSFDGSFTFAADPDDDEAWVLIVSSAALPKSIVISAKVTNMTVETYSWTPNTSSSLVYVSSGATTSDATIMCQSGAVYGSITLTMTGKDSLGDPVTAKAKVSVNFMSGVSLASITSTVGKVTNDAITWDLAKSSATITLKSDVALPKTLNVATQTTLTSKGVKLTKASIDSTRKTVTLQVALSGNIPADKKDTIVVKIGSLTCTIPVTYNGSQSSQSGINIGTRPY